jgi:predicted MFS family arabinose efflux permease
MQLIAPLLNDIARDLNTTPGHAGIVVTSYSLAAAAFALIMGPLSDRAGRKKVLIAGLALFTIASFLTYHVSTFNTLLIVRMVTGLAAGTLSTCSLSFAGDHYPYAQRGRAMGVLSMAYAAALVAGVPAGTFAAARFGWQAVFAGLAALAAAVLVVALVRLPPDPEVAVRGPAAGRLSDHFRKADRLAGMIAAFLTSGGLVGFLTYVGAWLGTSHGVSMDRIGLVFMASGIAAVCASPLSGWLADHAGKRSVIIWSNLILSGLFLVVANLDWGIGLVLGIAALSIAASARQAPLHALTSEIVGADLRGEYIAMRNAASQIGIATIAVASAYAFDSGGFPSVAMVAAVVTLLIPVSCFWLKEPDRR